MAAMAALRAMRGENPYALMDKKTPPDSSIAALQEQLRLPISSPVENQTTLDTRTLEVLSPPPHGYTPAAAAVASSRAPETPISSSEDDTPSSPSETAATIALVAMKEQSPFESTPLFPSEMATATAKPPKLPQSPIQAIFDLRHMTGTAYFQTALQFSKFLKAICTKENKGQLNTLHKHLNNGYLGEARTIAEKLPSEFHMMCARYFSSRTGHKNPAEAFNFALEDLSFLIKDHNGLDGESILRQMINLCS